MQKHEQLKKYLTQNNSFNKIELQTIVGKFKNIKTKKNEVLCEIGQVCDNFYFINSGCLRMYQIDSKGDEITGYFALEDSIISAVTSFIIQIPSRDILSAQEPSDLLVISRKDFYSLVDEIPEFNKIYQSFIHFALIHSQMRIYSFLGMSAKDKIRWVMEHEPKLLNRISSKAVASYLGMTRSTLSKLRAQL